jgi:hypothetical protein
MQEGSEATSSVSVAVPVAVAASPIAPTPAIEVVTSVVATAASDGDLEADNGECNSASRSGPKKNAWTQEEDALLSRIISEHGHGQWTQVAQYLPGRVGRQCRERWFNHLAPEVKKGDWSREEDQLIVAAVREHGTKWSTIQRQLPGRSDNSIKNRCARRIIMHAFARPLSARPLSLSPSLRLSVSRRDTPLALHAHNLRVWNLWASISFYPPLPYPTLRAKVLFGHSQGTKAREATHRRICWRDADSGCPRPRSSDGCHRHHSEY